jgi:hypothetical protein
LPSLKAAVSAIPSFAVAAIMRLLVDASELVEDIILHTERGTSKDTQIDTSEMSCINQKDEESVAWRLNTDCFWYHIIQKDSVG